MKKPLFSKLSDSKLKYKFYQKKKNIKKYVANFFSSLTIRYEPSQADVAVFAALPECPSAATYPHSARWFTHIQSYSASHPTLPGDATKDFSAYGPSTSATPAPVEEDDDEIDLFGSDDDEVDEEAERVKAARVAEYAAKKANKPKTIAKSVVTLDVKPWDDETGNFTTSPSKSLEC